MTAGRDRKLWHWTNRLVAVEIGEGKWRGGCCYLYEEVFNLTGLTSKIPTEDETAVRLIFIHSL